MYDFGSRKYSQSSMGVPAPNQQPKPPISSQSVFFKQKQKMQQQYQMNTSMKTGQMTGLDNISQLMSGTRSHNTSYDMNTGQPKMVFNYNPNGNQSQCYSLNQTGLIDLSNAKKSDTNTRLFEMSKNLHLKRLALYKKYNPCDKRTNQQLSQQFGYIEPGSNTRNSVSKSPNRPSIRKSLLSASPARNHQNV